MTTPPPGPVPAGDGLPPGESGWPYTDTTAPAPQNLLDIAARRFFGADPGEAMAVSLEAAVTEVLAAAAAVLETELRTFLADQIEAARPLGDIKEHVLIASGMASAARIVRGER